MYCVVPPAARLLTPFDLVALSNANGMMFVITVAVLFAGLLSYVSTAAGKAVSPAALVAASAMLVTAVRAVMVTVQVSPRRTAVNVPLTMVRPATTLVAVVQLPLPVVTALTVNTGVIALGSASENVTLPALAEPAPLTTVNTYCKVAPEGTFKGADESAPARPTRWVLAMLKSVEPTWKVACAASALLPAVVRKLLAAKVLT